MQNSSYMDAEVNGAMAAATAASWSFLRAVTVDVAERAAWLGYASDRVGDWEISAQRLEMGHWPPGLARLAMTLVRAGRVVLRWPAVLPLERSDP